MTQTDLRKLITEVLGKMGMYSDGARELIMGTCAQESLFMKHKRQLGNGPALGGFQMEPATMYDIWSNYLKYKLDIADLIKREFDMTGPDLDRLENDPVYGIVMCRLHYRRSPCKIPEAKDIIGLGRVWKDVYNTRLGKGHISEFVNNYRKYCSISAVDSGPSRK